MVFVINIKWYSKYVIKYKYFSISCCKYLSALRHIDDKYIDDLETFVRNDLLGILEAECKKRKAKFDDSQKTYFFGLYHAKTKDFRFLPGEKFILKEIGQYIQRLVNDEDETKFAPFKMPTNYKMPRKDTCQLFGCTFFGKQNIEKKKQRLDDLKHATTEPSLLKQSLLPKLRKEFKVNESELIDIEIVANGSKISALAQCVHCNRDKGKVQRIRIQYDRVKNSIFFLLESFKLI